jgi:hypothetical protein
MHIVIGTKLWDVLSNVPAKWHLLSIRKDLFGWTAVFKEVDAMSFQMNTRGELYD